MFIDVETYLDGQKLKFSLHSKCPRMRLYIMIIGRVYIKIGCTILYYETSFKQINPNLTNIKFFLC